LNYSRAYKVSLSRCKTCVYTQRD